MRILATGLIIAALCLPVQAQEYRDLNAQVTEDLYETVPGEKYANTDSTAPWNDPLMENDPFAPWNETLLRDDPDAPWNNALSRPKDTNAFLREQGVSNQDYYWK